jgi:uncharacterized protein
MDPRGRITKPQDGAHGFVPIADLLPLPWERSPEPPVDQDALARAGEHLERFAATLDPRERAALSALLVKAAGQAPIAALAALPPEDVLDARERQVYVQLAAAPTPLTLPMRSTLVVVMKATRLCNLRCTYCHFWREGPNQIMTFPVLARAIRDALRAPGVQNVEFVWHGGEVTLLRPSFYRKALWLQQQFRSPEQRVSNAIQTNGTHLTGEWLDFLHRYNIDVGISLDGPPEIHDTRRVDVSGRPTSARVREGLARLRAGGHEPGVLMVVDEDVITLGAERVLSYLIEIGAQAVGLINVIPENAPDGPGAYLPWQRYVEFLREVFRVWWPEHAERIVPREIADLIGQLTGRSPSTCLFAGDCFGGYLTIEPTGEVSACDKYIDDEDYGFGSVVKGNLADITGSGRLEAVRAANAAEVDEMRDCQWFNVCHGACPHDRRLNSWRLEGYDGRCCGLAPLLSDMAVALREAGYPVVIPVDGLEGAPA